MRQLYRNWVRPAFFQFGPERAHHLAMGGLHVGLRSRLARSAARAVLQLDHPMLQQRLWNIPFAHPVGLAAGFDKNAEAVEELAALGFSHVEIGTVTAWRQPGNPRPRCFRLPHDHSVINRMGFNNQGADAVAARLAAAYDPRGVGEQRRPGCVLGINVGKSTARPLDQALEDHAYTLERLAPMADYVVINVSCPNVQGVSGLQAADSLRPLLEGTREQMRRLVPGTPLLVKLGPDTAERLLDASVDVILGTGCDGVLCTNTSARRAGLRTPAARVAAFGQGGLSGAAIRARSTGVLARVARRVDGRVPVVGIGGIDSPEAAWEKVVHGADLVQIYTGFIYA
ncbi:MAG: quinone-dependent dihydroorotate dehydrogenase, partial [Planctomycetota bacterium]